MKVRMSSAQLRNIILEEVKGILQEYDESIDDDPAPWRPKSFSTQSWDDAPKGAIFPKDPSGTHPGVMTTGADEPLVQKSDWKPTPKPAASLPSNLLRLDHDDTFGYTLAPDGSSYTAYRLSTGKNLGDFTDAAGVAKVKRAARMQGGPVDVELPSATVPAAPSGGDEFLDLKPKAAPAEPDLPPTRRQYRKDIRQGKRAARQADRAARRAARGSLQETIERMVRLKIRELI